MRFELGPGRPDPLGAHWDGAGVNFALECEVAERVELCLFDQREHRLELQRSGAIWHAYVHDLSPGAQYGYRVHGPWDPARGQRCNPHKLLLDPYARALSGEPRWHDALCGTELFDRRDSAPYVPRALVVDDTFDWEGDRAPRTPWQDSLIYELHVRGFSQQNPALPLALRGSYAGLAQPESISHLLRLGVTAVELLPVQAFVDDAFLIERRLSNYWGYSPLAFFAPARRYASTPDPVREFKALVKTLHRAGIELILDVVYNHTCEGSERGPTLSLKGLDNARYYALDAADPSKYRDVTGCGNSLDATRAKRLILDSLRYWARDMHVDGFRFDLATTLGRDERGVFTGALLREIARDDVLRQCKLIAEPWDLGPDGYRLGHFPAPMREWNDKYRDAVRRLWKGEPSPDIRERMRGSRELFRHGNASIDFVTAHDGFTLRDVVSYARKHNLANGENGRDGSAHEVSFNCGFEGETSDRRVRRLRARMQRNLLATLLFSRGTPMLLAGDELGRTQRGNNNAYCQDNELSYLDWQLDDERAELLRFTQRLIRLRKRWLRQDEGEWTFVEPRAFSWRRGDLLLLLNAEPHRQRFELPAGRWQVVLDTAGVRELDDHYEVAARALAVLSETAPDTRAADRPAGR
jgi:glycogen operon protein